MKTFSIQMHGTMRIVVASLFQLPKPPFHLPGYQQRRSSCVPPSGISANLRINASNKAP